MIDMWKRIGKPLLVALAVIVIFQMMRELISTYLPYNVIETTHEIALSIYCLAIVLLGCCGMVCISAILMSLIKHQRESERGSALDQKIIEKVLASDISEPCPCKRLCRCARKCSCELRETRIKKHN